MIDEWERKQHARIRRERALVERLDMRARRIESAKRYQRGYKHRPKTADDWLAFDEELD